MLRINNDNFCDMAALAIFDDSTPGVLKNEFLRYKNVPGLAIGHPAIIYDNVTDLYALFKPKGLTSTINHGICTHRHWDPASV